MAPDDTLLFIEREWHPRRGRANDVAHSQPVTFVAPATITVEHWARLLNSDLRAASRYRRVTC